MSSATQTSRPTVAITGLNGYIAIYVALKFLKNGYDVRGSVRSASSIEKIKSHPVWKEYVDSGRVKLVVVSDIVEGDFTELIQGAEIIAHLAAPVHMDLASWDTYKIPTINGVINLLNQANKVPSIKAISLMSSMAAVFSPAPNEQQLGKVYTEADYFPLDEATVAGMTPATNPYASVLWYCAAKKYAEFAVQDWIKNNKHDFSIATLCPPMVYGPLLHVTSPEELNGLSGSQAPWTSVVKGKDQAVLDPESTTYVDPRDVADAFYEAAVRRKNERYLIAQHEYTYQMWANEFRKQRPDLDAYFPLGNPDAPTPRSQNFWVIDPSKSINNLGLKYRNIPETAKDTLEHYESIGLFKIPPGAWVKSG
ncbi:uncharacterized protein L201_004498 [Kwoniella dendrophila CBS 6074]|uniref:Thioester reductase (TE) domain-containing protein n=1 Tax=Kwoniella dendrophila CBS 6074 TaxID=1295534 RepID=A0AAX4JXI6_9TREE